MNKFTKNQDLAIHTEGSILVSASAGTGKTSVLTERVVQKILGGTSVSNLLVMTFSNAAANEMKNRIHARLTSEVVNSNDEDYQRAVQSQIDILNISNIQTIHSFCNDVGREFFHHVEISPDFRVADSLEINSLKLRAINEVLDTHYSVKKEELYNIESLTSGRLSIEEEFIDIHNELLSIPDWKTWLLDSISNYNETTEIPEIIKSYLINTFKSSIKEYEELLDMAHEVNDIKLDKNIEGIEKEYQALLKFVENINNSNLEELDHTKLKVLKQRMSFASDFFPVRDKRNEARDTIVKDFLNKEFNITDELKKISDIKPTVELIIDIILDFDTKYKELKAEKKLIDFSDMEHYASEILKDEKVSSYYRDNFEYVFVDEYQDTNDIQESIISKISRVDNLFCVGDVKQSIYSFRSSDPQIFLNRKALYENNPELGTAINLNDNFRSSESVVNSVNDVFSVSDNYSTEIQYDLDQHLVHSRSNTSSLKNIIHTIDMKQFTKHKDMDIKDIEAYNIVSIIQEELNSVITDRGTGDQRPVEYKDITIISRQLSGLSDILTQALDKHDIPYIIDKTGNLLDTIEVQVLINILKLSINPFDNLALVSFLRMEYFGVEDQDIIDFKVENDDVPIYENILNLALGGLSKATKIVDFVSKLKSMSFSSGVYDFINFVDSELSYTDSYMFDENFKQKEANINKFKSIASDYDANNSGNLREFIDITTSTGKEITREANYIENPNAVRIMTTHQSKGLEFPVVILPFLGRSYNKMSQLKSFQVNKSVGFGVNFTDSLNYIKSNTLIRDIVDAKNTEKQIEEELRLLYVAMTRATERLHLQSEVSGPMKDNNIKSSFDWIQLSVLSTHGEKSVISEIYQENWEHKSSSSEEIFVLAREYFADLGFDNPYEFLRGFKLKEEEVVQVDSEIQSSRLSPSSSGVNSNNVDYGMLDLESSVLEKGTITHRVLELIDYSSLTNKDSLNNSIKELVSNGYISVEEAGEVSIESLLWFGKSKVSNQVINAQEVFKELEVKGLVQNRAKGSNMDIIMKGIIDLVYKHDDKWHLVDFKTDNLYDISTTNNRVEIYTEQLNKYAEAMEKLYDISIDTKSLVFLEAQKTIEI